MFVFVCMCVKMALLVVPALCCDWCTDVWQTVVEQEAQRRHGVPSQNHLGKTSRVSHWPPQDQQAHAQDAFDLLERLDSAHPEASTRAGRAPLNPMSTSQIKVACLTLLTAFIEGPAAECVVIGWLECLLLVVVLCVVLCVVCVVYKYTDARCFLCRRRPLSIKPCPVSTTFPTKTPPNHHKSPPNHHQITTKTPQR